MGQWYCKTMHEAYKSCEPLPPIWAQAGDQDLPHITGMIQSSLKEAPLNWLETRGDGTYRTPLNVTSGTKPTPAMPGIPSPFHFLFTSSPLPSPFLRERGARRSWRRPLPKGSDWEARLPRHFVTFPVCLPLPIHLLLPLFTPPPYSSILRVYSGSMTQPDQGLTNYPPPPMHRVQGAHQTL